MNTLASLCAVVPEPTIAVEDCPICRHIPRSCSRFVKGGDVERDTIPPQVSQLAKLLDVPAVHRCPTCNRLYLYESEYEFIYGGSEDSDDWTRLTHRELLHHEAMLPRRVDDPAVCGHLGSPRRVVNTHVRQYFERHVVVGIGIGDGDESRTVTIALPDDGPAVRLTLATLAAIVAVDPVADLDQRDIALRYAEHMDSATSEYRRGFLRVPSFDAIPWRADLTDDDRMLIKDLKAASRVKPLRVEQLPDRWILTFWVVAERKLICRVLTLLRTGELIREDAIVGDNIPTHVGARWSWDHKTQRSVPVS